MKKVYGILGIIWSCLYTIPGYLLFLLLWATGQVHEVIRLDYLILSIDLDNEGWFCKKLFLERGWAGYSIGGISFVVDGYDTSSRRRLRRTVKHEYRHSLQYFWWGPLFGPVYVLSSIYIWIFYREKHSYYDNPFEVGARRYAGQDVEIPRDNWMDGKNDRWSWW